MKQKTFKLSGIVLVCISVMVVESLSQIIYSSTRRNRKEVTVSLLDW